MVLRPAIHKVDTMREKIGYPAQWRNYSSLTVDCENFISDLHEAELLNRNEELSRIREWFTPSDRAAFNRMTSCEVKEYSSFQVLPDLKLDGALSVGENTADNGGLRIAYKAFQKVLAQQPPEDQHRKLDGFTPDQRFFIGFAQTWCETRNPDYQRVRGQTDPHPPGEFRVNGTVQNFQQFGEAFGCRRGQPMMPVNACHVW